MLDNTVRCPSCGFKNLPGTKVCKCGFDIEDFNKWKQGADVRASSVNGADVASNGLGEKPREPKMWSTRSFAISGGIFAIYAFSGALLWVDSAIPGLIVGFSSIVGAVLGTVTMGLLPFVLVAVVLAFVTPWKGKELASKAAIIVSYPVALFGFLRALVGSVRAGAPGWHWVAGLVVGGGVAVVLWMLPTWRRGPAETQAGQDVQAGPVD